MNRSVILPLLSLALSSAALSGGHALAQQSRHRPNPGPFSAALGPATLGLSRRHFGNDLWTSRMEDSRTRFSDGPVFSGALYFVD